MSPTKRTNGNTGQPSDVVGSMVRTTAEKSILGAILLAPQVYRSTTELRVDDFSCSAHRIVYRRIRDLAESSRPIDITTVVEELSRHGELEHVGGPAAVGDLVDGVPDNLNVHEYVRLVREAAGMRQVYSLTDSLPFAVQRGLEGALEHLDLVLQGPRSLARSLRRQRGPVNPTNLNGAAILQDVVGFINRFVSMTRAQLIVVAVLGFSYVWIRFCGCDAVPLHNFSRKKVWKDSAARSSHATSQKCLAYRSRHFSRPGS